jgi:ApaG protein
MSSSTFVAVTRGIQVSVMPQYLANESDPDEGRYFWAYTIDIENEGRETVQLRSRVWQITDETGKVERCAGRAWWGKRRR